MPDAAEVDRLLTASRAAHARYRTAANPVLEGGRPVTPPNYAEAEQQVAEALALRLQAHEADHEHTSPGWAEDTAPHEQLVAFYQKYPTIP